MKVHQRTISIKWWKTKNINTPSTNKKYTHYTHIHNNLMCFARQTSVKLPKKQKWECILCTVIVSRKSWVSACKWAELKSEMNGITAANIGNGIITIQNNRTIAHNRAIATVTVTVTEMRNSYSSAKASKRQ